MKADLLDGDFVFCRELVLPRSVKAIYDVRALTRPIQSFVFEGLERRDPWAVVARRPFSADRRLCLTNMPQPSRQRAGKRKRPPEAVASPLALELVSLIRVSGRGRAVKKRIIETVDSGPLDPPGSPTIPDDDPLPLPPSQPDPYDSEEGEPTEIFPDAASRSVSVRVSFSCHVTRLQPSSLEFKSGSHTAQSISEKSIAQKPLCINVRPAFHVSRLQMTNACARRPQSTAV